MVTSLIHHERIMTTTPKAKELRRVAENMITYAKKGKLLLTIQIPVQLINLIICFKSYS